MSLNPQEVIVPIIAVDESHNIVRFLGTGSFVGDPPLLVTAEHVIRDWQLGFGIAVLPNVDRVFPAVVREADRDVDLAILEVDGYAPPTPLILAEPGSISLNKPAVSYEYGTTRTHGRAIVLDPATRVGNVTRIMNLTDRYGRAGEEILELSFPALRGASGAPVVSGYRFTFWGVIIANASYHLLPAQIESVMDEDGSVTEETRFMLPQALAVNVGHVHELLASV